MLYNLNSIVIKVELLALLTILLFPFTVTNQYSDFLRVIISKNNLKFPC